MTFWTKSILALILIGAALINLGVILELLGRKEKRFNPKTLRTIHRINGYFFFLFISYFCLKIMRGGGQELSARGALHGFLAVATFSLLLVKILIVRFYRQFYSMAVPMGLGVFLLAVSVTATSAGYYFTMHGAGATVSSVGVQEGLAGEGAVVFAENCADCHFADKTDAKIGPGLKGLFQRKTLPVSGREVTEENIRKQLKTPFIAMPSFPDLPEEEVQALVAFLEVL
jgi:mono/diheme cytochrome c family protein